MVLSIGFKVEAIDTTWQLLGQFFWVNQNKGYVMALPAYKGLNARWVVGGCLREI